MFHDIGKAIREMFPEQTKSPLAIAIWTLIFLIDIALVLWAASAMGIHILGANSRKSLFIYFFLAAILFYGECVIYDKIRGIR